MTIQGTLGDAGILFDLGTKLTGTFQFSLADASLIGSPKDSAWTPRCVYGPYADFLRLPLALNCTSEANMLIWTHENVVTCRYVFLYCPTYLARYIETRFIEEMRDVRQVGRLTSDQPLYQQIFDVSAHTLHLCMMQHFHGNSTLPLQFPANQEFARQWRGERTSYVLMDGARRDREVWMGDLLPEVRSAVAIFDDREIVRSSLEALLARQEANGHVPASSISNQTFYEYDAWFAIVLYEYDQLTDDGETVKVLIERAVSAMRFLVSRLDGQGLEEFPKMHSWAWTMSRSGYVTSSHCVLMRAFECIAILIRRYGYSDAQSFETLAEGLRERINHLAYDYGAHCYRDMLEPDLARYSLDANCFALIFDIAPREEIPAILDAMKARFWTPYGSLLMSPKEKPDGQNWVHNDHVWPFVVAFEVEARFRHGDAESAYELMQRTWGGMLAHGAQTFWEIIDGSDGSFMKRRIVEANDDRDTWNSASHGWSAGLPQIITRYILGVSAAEPGYRRFAFNPCLIHANVCEADIPTACGVLSVWVERDGDNIVARFTLPEGCEGRTDLPLYKNGKPVLDGRINQSGEYMIRMGGEAHARV